MGRYDWEQKQQALERARVSPGSWVSSATFSVGLLALLLLGAAFFDVLGGEAKSSNTTLEVAPDQSGMGQPIDGNGSNGDRVADVHERPEVADQSASMHTARFRLCGKMRTTCVVDGDTFWLDGEKIRVADIDTPEISQPHCAAEKELGNRAKNRFLSLLNEGPFELSVIGDRDEDQYGRKLRIVTRNGRSLGDQLVSEGLARTWTGQREPWC